MASLLLLGSTFVSAIAMSKSEAEQIVRGFIEEKMGYDIDSISVAQSKEMMTRLDIALGDSITVDEPSWMFFVDPTPNRSWGHVCKYVIISPESKKVRVATKEMYPDNSEDWTFIIRPMLDEIKGFDYTTRFVKPGLYVSKKTSTVKSNAYAILISGGESMFGNWQDGWNEVSIMYQALTDLHGYKKENIVTIMSDGDNPAPDMIIGGKEVSSPLDLDGDGESDIDYASTNANVKLAFEDLATKVKEGDDVFVYIVSHGNVDVVALYGSNQYLRAYQLKSYLNNLKAKSVTVYVSACHSGSFVDDLSGTNRTIVTSTSQSESGWAGDIGTFWDPFFGALTGVDFRTDAIVNCDVNGDGKNDLYESYIYGIAGDYNSDIRFIGSSYHTTPHLWTSKAMSQGIDIEAGSGRIMSGESFEANSAISNAHIVYQSPKLVKLTSGFSYKQSGLAAFKAVVNENMLKDCQKTVVPIPDEEYMLKLETTESDNVQIEGIVSVSLNFENRLLSIVAANSLVDNIVVTDISGKILVEKDVNANQAEIDLSAYPKGVYIVEVVTENKSYVEKVVLK